MTAVSTIQTTNNLKDMLGKMAPQMADVLPKHVTPDRMVKLAMVAAHRNPAILRCTQISVMEAVMRASELGLDCSGTMGDAYIVPYKDQATMIVGYRGLAKLARQSGEIRRIECNIVCERDEFIFDEGSDFRLVFRRNLSGERGAAIGAYAMAQLSDGTFQAEFMTVTEVDKIRNGSAGKNSPAWKNHWGEMARKTVFRRLAKWLPMSNEKFRDAVEYDNDTTGYVVNTQAAPSHALPSLSDALDTAEQEAAAKDEQGGESAETAPAASGTASHFDTLVHTLMERTGADAEACHGAIDRAVQAAELTPDALTDDQFTDFAKRIESGAYDEKV